MSKEKTLVIIKPNAVINKYIGQIITRLEQHANILEIKRWILEDYFVREFYAEHVNKPFFKSLVISMSFQYIYSIILEGDNVIDKIRKAVGSTDPKEAEPGTIRADFGESVEANAVHASDSIKSACREIKLFYPDFAELR